MNLIINGFNALISAILVLFYAAAPVCSYNWLQFGGSPQHSGTNLSESLITSANVSHLSSIFQVTLPSSIDGPVAYVSAVQTANGPQDMIFGETQAGSLLAFNAHTGATVWSKPSTPPTCKIRNTPYDCIVHSAAAVDPNLKYVYSYSLDGMLHKYQVTDGVEFTDGGWPEVVTLKPDLEKQSASLVFATANDGHTYLYVAFASYAGDWGEYQGHIVAIDLNTGNQKVFNMVCSNQTVHFTYAPGTPDCADIKASVWGRASVLYEPSLNKIFMTTANGTYDPSIHDWGTSVIALNPDGSGLNGDPLDSYTPSNFYYLSNFDIDLGSTAPALLPVPANSAYPHLALQSGKDGKIRLLNLANLSGQGGPGHTGGEIGAIVDVPMGDPKAAPPDYEVRTAPLVWVNPADSSTWVFISNDYGLCAFELVFDNGGNPSMASKWVNTSYTLNTSPSMANNVLYMASSVDATHGLIRAIDPLTGNTLWSNNSIGTIHWSAPVVDNGVLYISDESNHLTAFAVNGSLPVTSSCSASAKYFNWLPSIFR